MKKTFSFLLSSLLLCLLLWGCNTQEPVPAPVAQDIPQPLCGTDVMCLDMGIHAMADSDFSDLDMLKWIYTVAFSDTKIITESFLDTPEQTLDAIFNNDSAYPALSKMVVSKETASKAFDAATLSVGDVVLTEHNFYIQGSLGLYALENGAHLIDTLPKPDRFAVLRPWAAMVNFTPAEPQTTPEELTPEQEAVVETAKAYLLRGDRAQYSDTRFVINGRNYDAEFRWQTIGRQPEEYTSDNWGFVNCAAFTYDLYRTALDYSLPLETNTCRKQIDYGNRVYYYTRMSYDTHTPEEKAEIEKEFTETLQPGDIIVIYRHSKTGHSMLYVGNGLIIHSTGSTYLYDTGTERYEPTVRYHRVHDYFFTEGTTGYVFDPVSELAIIRPLDRFSGEIPGNTQKRVTELQGIRAEKLCSHQASHTVNPGEEITYGYHLYNANDHAVTLEIVDLIPQYVALGEDGTEFRKTIELPAGGRASISYTVTVDPDAPEGAWISGSGGTINGVCHDCNSVQIRKTLTGEQQAALVSAANTGSSLSGFARLNEIYQQAIGRSAYETDDLEAFLAKIFRPSVLGEYNGFPLYDISDLSLVAPTLYGGYRLYTYRLSPTDRTRLPKPKDLMIGDVLVVQGESMEIYLFTGDDTLLRLTNGTEPDSVSAALRLEGLLGADCFFTVLRPSFA